MFGTKTGKLQEECMSEGENKESGPEAPPPSSAPGPWLPPRLRDRLEAADAPPPKTAGPLGGILATALVLGLAGAVFWWAGQKRAVVKKAEEAKAAAALAAAVADSITQVRMADSLRTVARADSAAAFLALPAWKQQEILTGVKGDGGSGANSDEAGKFVVDAGTYLFEEPAERAATAIKASTRMEVRVVPVEADGATSYHVYVGNFTQRGAAAHAADQLLAKGTADLARVVKLD
jgi:hypothetical protein